MSAPTTCQTWKRHVLPSKDALVGAFKGQSLRSVRTPALVIDRAIFRHNCARMHEKVHQLGARFRAHIKSHKTAEGTRLQLVSESLKSSSVVVSTLMEAWQLVDCGLVEDGTVNDVLYGMPVNITNLELVSQLACELQNHNATLHLLVDNLAQVKALQEFNETRHPHQTWSVFVKVDIGYRRCGLPPDSTAFKELLELLLFGSPSISIFGFYSHSGHAYRSRSVEDASTILVSELEYVNNAASLALSLISGSRYSKDHTTPFVLSIGSTPVAHVISSAWPVGSLNGVLEIHAGNYALLDMQQLSTTLIGRDQIAIRVLATTISCYPGRGTGGADEALCDAGAIALSKDTFPAQEWWGVVKFGDKFDSVHGGGQWRLKKICQEHGILEQNLPAASDELENGAVKRGTLEVGEMVEIVPQHACLAAAAHPWFYIVDSESGCSAEEIVDVWVPWKGW